MSYPIFAIPSGSLKGPTMEVLRAAGIPLEDPTPDDQLGVFEGWRFQVVDRIDLTRMMNQRLIHAGITGEDIFWNKLPTRGVGMATLETYSRVSKRPVEYVLAVRKGEERFYQDLCKDSDNGHGEVCVGAELHNLAFDRLKDKYPKRFHIKRLYGKEEAALQLKFCDVLFVARETGNTLRAYGHEVVEREVFYSRPVLLNDPDARDDLINDLPYRISEALKKND